MNILELALVDTLEFGKKIGWVSQLRNPCFAPLIIVSMDQHLELVHSQVDKQMLRVLWTTGFCLVPDAVRAVLKKLHMAVPIPLRLLRLSQV